MQKQQNTLLNALMNGGIRMVNKELNIANCEAFINSFKNLTYNEKKYILGRVNQSLLLEVAFNQSLCYEDNAKEEAERIRRMGEKVCYT